MRLEHKHSTRRRASVFLGIVGLLWSSAALADNASKPAEETDEPFPEYGKCYARAAKVVTAEGESGEVAIPAYGEFITKISLPVPIKQVHHVKSKVWVQQNGDHSVNAALSPDTDAPTNLAIDTMEGDSLSVVLEPVDSADLANSSLEVVREPKEDVCMAMVRTALDAREQEQAKLDPLDQRKERARYYLAETHKDPIPHVATERAREPREPHASLGRVTWYENEPYMRFTFENPTSKPYEIAMIHLIEGEHDGVQVDAVFGDEVRKEPGVLAIVEPYGEVTGMVLVPEGLEVDTVRLRFFGPNSTRPVLVAAQRFDFVPVPPHEVAKRERFSQIAVSVRGLFGGFWADDAAGQDEFAATTLAGLGLRIQRGYEKGFATEGEILFGRTGKASFADIEWGGMTGDVARRATLARVLGGVAMRYGYDYVFTGRLGVGAQIASYDSTFTMAGALMDGPGDGFEVDAVVSVGAGFDARLGEGWGLGASGTLTSTFYKGPRSLEVGLHLGYGWN